MINFRMIRGQCLMKIKELLTDLLPKQKEKICKDYKDLIEYKGNKTTDPIWIKNDEKEKIKVFFRKEKDKDTNTVNIFMFIVEHNEKASITTSLEEDFFSQLPPFIETEACKSLS